MRPKRLVYPILALAVCVGFAAAPAFAQCEDEQTDPIEDVAGVLDESDGTLYTTEDEEADVVAALELTQTPDGYAEERVVVDEKTGAQTTETRAFAVQYTPWPGLFIPARPLCQCASGIRIVYRHRTCRTIQAGFSSGCHQLAGGGSFRFNRQPLRKCVLFQPWRYCVERNQAWHTTTTYQDNFCQIPQSVTTRCSFMC